MTAAVIDYGTACCIHQLQIQSTSEILISSYMLDMDRVVTLRCDASRCKGLHSPSSATPTFGKPEGKEGETNRLSSALTSGKWFSPRRWRLYWGGKSCRCSWHPRIPSGVVFGGLRDWAGVLFSAVSYDTVTEEEQPSPDMKWQRTQAARVKNRPPQWQRQTSALRTARMRKIHEGKDFRLGQNLLSSLQATHASHPWMQLNPCLGFKLLLDVSWFW